MRAVPAPEIEEKPVAIEIALHGGGDLTLYFGSPQEALDYCKTSCQRGFITQSLINDPNVKYGVAIFPIGSVQAMRIFDRNDEAKLAPFPKAVFTKAP